jgi:hypothetical protein
MLNAFSSPKLANTRKINKKRYRHSLVRVYKRISHHLD